LGDRLNFRKINNNLLPACYKWIVYDSACDGYKWWANTAAENGNVRINYPELYSLKVKTPTHPKSRGFYFSLNLPE
jgi:hypothetical protein